MVFARFAAVIALAALATGATAAPLVHPGVHRTLRSQGTVNLTITLKGGVDAPIAAVQEAGFADRGQKIASLVTSLQSHAKTSQANVDALLAQEAAGAASFTSHETFWISNQKIIKGATIELVEKLAALSDIVEIREEVVIPTPKINFAGNSTANAGRRLATNEYGVTKIGAPTVWAGGNTGTGVVVGSIDTGVLATHTALKANYRTTYGWYDATAKKTTAYDDLGHGTHTMGTIAGSGGIGVAPGATWISCKAFTADGGSESALLSCAQFITCPTTPSGTNKDCTKAPRVVSNSWGGGQGDTFFASAISSWQTAGIIPVFANGNAGPACKTANSPGDASNVIAVGATDSTDGLASFSSKGPSVNGLVKPEVSAPGYQVRSAWYTGTSAYNTISGTSMATPHVAGAIALLLKAKPTLTYAQVKKAVITGVDTSTLKATGYTCGGTKDTTFPNNQYGYGRINAVKILAASV